MKKFWKDHSLSITLFSISIIMIVWSWWLGRALWDGKGVYFDFWLAQTVISCEPDFMGMAVLVVVSKWLKERGSPASKPRSDENNGGGRSALDKE